MQTKAPHKFLSHLISNYSFCEYCGRCIGPGIPPMKDKEIKEPCPLNPNRNQSITEVKGFRNEQE